MCWFLSRVLLENGSFALGYASDGVTCPCERLQTAAFRDQDELLSTQSPIAQGRDTGHGNYNDDKRRRGEREELWVKRGGVLDHR